MIGAHRFCLLGMAMVAAACRADAAPRKSAAATGPRFEIIVHQPDKLTSIETGRTDATGRETRVGCATCHSIEHGLARKDDAGQLEAFHRGLAVRHGELVCRACHATARPDKLVLAGEGEIPMRDAMRLCAQCHGPQFRDYQRGSHGGMSGHWDLSRGPRLRNHCVDCHDPHEPAFVGMRPVLPPKERRPLAERTP
jgi:formate-dependent nitrite reductase cytochrome c552 subunit